jgi:DNA-binding MarR family transcriptional regulator/GNAT superfamily N-acetyltransferase
MAKDGQVAAVRHFNRFYTRAIGVLQEGHLGSPFSLAQARVLYELAHRRSPTAADLGADLGLDPGYLSRILAAFRARDLVVRQPSPRDRRRELLRLTTKGRRAFAPLDARAREDVRRLLAPLPSGDAARLVQAMRLVERLLGGAAAPRPSPAKIRAPRPGDMGWVVERHGAVYDEEWGWGARFEGLVAEIVAQFLAAHDPRRERAWIAEQDGERVGSVFLVAKTRTVAKLRLLLVEPAARGTGLGSRLVDTCVRFARSARYRRVVLWTQSILGPARHIYAKSGFVLVGQEPNREFGKGLVSETWSLDL